MRLLPALSRALPLGGFWMPLGVQRGRNLTSKESLAPTTVLLSMLIRSSVQHPALFCVRGCDLGVFQEQP